MTIRLSRAAVFGEIDWVCTENAARVGWEGNEARKGRFESAINHTDGISLSLSL